MTFVHHLSEGPRVLVAHASRHGSTAEIADRIAERLRDAGVRAVSVDVAAVDEDPTEYDAFVVGGAVYVGHWLKPLTRFVRRHEDVLAGRPVWVFGSGPLGEGGADQHEEGTTPPEPAEFAEFHDVLEPRDERVFAGKWDPEEPPVGLAERIARLVPVRAEVLRSGDFRDWTVIDAWASTIASALVPVRTRVR